jgi:hypothetical protein
MVSTHVHDANVITHDEQDVGFFAFGRNRITGGEPHQGEYRDTYSNCQIQLRIH